MNDTTEELRSQEVEVKKTRFPFWLWALVPTALSGQMLLPLTAWGQAITPDGTLPTQVMQDGDNYTIEGGGRAGGNLFHSFQEFSVPTGGEAFFNNAVDVDNIFSRVTGGNISNIDGLIRANGGANLFLINPAGIVFGPNARLNIGGSFLGSVASGMLFPDGTEFNATNQSTPLLTINAPIGLQFRGDEGNVVNRSVANDIGLEVQSGRTLGLVGGDVSLDGGFITAPGGRVELGGLAFSGTVGLNDDGSLSFPDGVARGNVLFANEAFVDVRAGGGGSIAVNARNIEMRGESSLDAGIGEDMGAPGSKAGDVTLNATESIIVRQSSNVRNRVSTGGIGNSGDINVRGSSLLLSDGGFFGASTLGQGNAGNLNVDVDGPVNLTGVDEDGEVSQFSSSVAEGAVGNGGEIKIRANSVSLSDGALVGTLVFEPSEGLPGGRGNAGNVAISASGEVRLEDEGGIVSGVETGAVGTGGNIDITTASSVSLSNGAIVGIFTFGEGNAGNVTIEADGNVRVENGFISSGVAEDAVGQGGNIEITGRSVSLTNGAAMFTGTLGEGDAGSVRIDASEEVRLEGGIIASNVFEGAVGQGGNIEITGRSVSVTNGTVMSARTFGEGDAGSVIISSDGEVKLSDESRIFSNVQTGAVGQGGNIEITGGSISVTNETGMLASTFGEGDAGTVRISSDGEVSLEGGLIGSSVAEGGVGQGGNIEITGGSVSVANEAFLLASTDGEGDAGSVRISSDGEVSLEGRLISSTVGEEAVGQGGNIFITGRSVSVTNEAFLLADTFGEGNAGNVRIDASEEVRLEGGTIGSNVGKEAVGQGGNIFITGRSVSVANEAFLLAITSGEGDAGSVRISSDGEVSLEGGIIASNVFEGAVGQGGNIEITGRSLSMSNGAELTTSSFGQGDAGNLTVNTSGRIELRNDSKIRTNATGTATGGNITISTEEFLIAFPEGDNDITANAQQGPGGQVNITADGVLGIDFREETNSRTNDITARSETGPQGDVTFNTPNADIIQGLVELSENVVDPNEIVAQACRPNRTGGSSLIETGRGGLPPTPYDPLTDDTTRVGGEVVSPRLADLPDPEQIVTKVERTEEITSDDIQPARGWFVNEKGNIVLTPYPTPNVTGRQHSARPGCGPR